MNKDLEIWQFAIKILPLETPRGNLAIMNSKAVGEPPLIYEIGDLFCHSGSG